MIKSFCTLRPKRDLVADLVKITHRLGTLAIKPTDCQADLVQAAKHLVDLPRHHQRGQVKHHADAHSGADVGRAGGQVSEGLVVSVGDLLFDQVVDPVDSIPGRFEVEPALHHLDPQVILFVDHQAEFLVAADGHRTRAAGLGQLAADQLPLDKELAVDRGKLFNIDVEQVVLIGKTGNRGLQLGLNPAAILRGSPADERVVGEVARQADATGNHDVGLGAHSPEPFTAVASQIFKFHVRVSGHQGGVPRHAGRDCILPSYLLQGGRDTSSSSPCKTPALPRSANLVAECEGGS